MTGQRKGGRRGALVASERAHASGKQSVDVVAWV